MNSAIIRPRHTLRNWQLLIFSYFVPVLLVVPTLWVTFNVANRNLFLILMTMIGAACGTAFFVSFYQMEFLNRSFTFLLPGLRSSLLKQHYLAVGIVALLVIASVMLMPAFSGFGVNLFSLGLSTAAFLLGLYALVTLVVFHFPYSSWLPFNGTWLAFMSIKFWMDIPSEKFIGFLDHPEIWLPLAGILGWFTARRLADPGLHRRLVEQPYISVVDLKNATKIEQFKQARAKAKGQKDTESRPGMGLIARVREKGGLAWATGRQPRAIVWEGVQALLLTSIARSRLRLFLLSLLMPVMIFLMGYYDGKVVLREDTDLAGWFPGLTFMLCYLFVLIFHYIKTRPLGLLRSRRDMLQAGWMAMGLVTAVTMATSGLIWLSFYLGSLVLPDLTWNNCLIEFQTAPVHLLFLPLVYLPLQFIIYILWRMKGSVVMLQQMGTLTFFLFHALLNMGGYELMAWPVTAFAALCWLVLPFAWHWRVWKTDLA